MSSGSYGLHVWPCAPVLAQYLWYHRNVLPKKCVLELGAGTALPGVLAAKCGAKVIVSDSSLLPACLRISQLACAANDVDVSVVGLTWGLFTPPLLNLPPLDLIVASDCFYDPSVFEEILVTVSYLLDRNPLAQFFCTYQERACDWSLEALLNKWELSCFSVPLHSFDADIENIADSGLPGSHKIHLFQIRKRAAAAELTS